jgi:transposase
MAVNLTEVGSNTVYSSNIMDSAVDSTSNSSGNRFDIAVRAQILTLKMYTDMTVSQICELTKCSKSTVERVYRTALKRGYSKPNPIKAEYVVDGAHTGRPRKRDEAAESVLLYIKDSKSSRAMNLTTIAQESGACVARITVYRILTDHGFSKVKRTTKPGLSKAQRTARLN